MATFADDDYYDPHEDDYEEDNNEMSPEDKVAMAVGVADVQEALREDASKVSLAQIQEALWHYYYDVTKSVAYLQKTFISPPPKSSPKKAQDGEFSTSFPSSSAVAYIGAAGADLGRYKQGAHRPELEALGMSAFSTLKSSSMPMDAYFYDMPWLQTSKERQTTFIAPWSPPGGLMGGSEGAPKMSKLQALAAARKKKTEQKKEQEKESQAEQGLQDLSISSRLPIEQTQHSTSASSSPGLPIRKGESLLPEVTAESETVPLNNTDHPMSDVEAQINLAGQRHTPSAFARTLIGSAPGASQRNKEDVFAMTYASSSSYFASVFSEPSPDDVVFAAQAKGSNFTRTK